MTQRLAVRLRKYEDIIENVTGAELLTHIVICLSVLHMVWVQASLGVQKLTQRLAVRLRKYEDIIENVTGAELLTHIVSRPGGEVALRVSRGGWWEGRGPSATAI
ncbi:hypothetical protein J6590_017025 [Homalodisca vitripennis]|nr:hypothetical protein J6590_017025 [Homalodisca vitripennis]